MPLGLGDQFALIAPSLCQCATEGDAHVVGVAAREETMKAVLTRSLIAGSVLIALSALAATDDKGFVRIAPDEVQWKDLPNGRGAQIATLQGDPTKPGIYVQRVKFPPHVMDRPHWHPEERHVTVLKGTWYTGTGDKFAPEHAVPLKPGSYMMHPAKAVHWDGSASDEEVIVQVIGYGPSGTTPEDPSQPFWVEYKQ
jgi:quercetin dioxygenase-like cupin family protein